MAGVLVVLKRGQVARSLCCWQTVQHALALHLTCPQPVSQLQESVLQAAVLTCDAGPQLHLSHHCGIKMLRMLPASSL